ncbi:3-hydroxybutyryl-CoA dehydratase [Advenella sp. S44]|uniref:enoyl-CoA hydratase/isomerase family protein n=1 Tax=Advenella sp. S44 TaxID=1982755 RepID=UPI000C29A485|nr:enoyl-CoA hydratase/isomerase family protein [Advenella sp. S44]PJX28128.1 3-hydroxybutyryl-CoA dehydratase [Advenella sp. S44]
MTSTETTLPKLNIDGHLAIITLNKPHKANSLDSTDLLELSKHIYTINQQEEVLVLQVKSTGKYFCSGYDLRGFGEKKYSFEDISNMLEDARPVTIAVLNGGVYGGGTDLALACDFRIGNPTVNMFMPAVRLGLHFYERGLKRYVARLGLNAAKQLFLTAEKIDANEMLKIGYLTHLINVEDQEKVVDDLSHKLNQMAPLALLGMKKHLNRIARGSLDLNELKNDISIAAKSEDIREGALAWAEKRQPVFKGK